MPVSAPHPCNQPGCGAVVRNTRFCDLHARARRQADDQRRGSAYSRGYDRAWQSLRAVYLAEHPLCVMCEADGLVRAATVVDHIQAIEDRPDLRLDPANLRPLCKRHHDQRTARDQAWGRARR